MTIQYLSVLWIFITLALGAALELIIIYMSAKEVIKKLRSLRKIKPRKQFVRKLRHDLTEEVGATSFEKKRNNS